MQTMGTPSKTEVMAFTAIQKMENAIQAFHENKKAFPKQVAQFTSFIQKAKISDFDPSISVTYNNEHTSLLHIAHQKAEMCPELNVFEKVIEQEFSEEVAFCDFIDQSHDTIIEVTDEEREALYADGKDFQPSYQYQVTAQETTKPAPKKKSSKKSTYSTKSAWHHYKNAQRNYEAR